MLDIIEGKKATRFARNVIESYVKSEKTQLFDFEEIFKQKLGVFVTIKNYSTNDLRGCIGIPQPIMTLKEAIAEAGKSVTNDPRFPRLREKELDKIVIEITILTKPELVMVNNPKEYLSIIKIGRDGLIVEKGNLKGLLLPQVPIEQNWSIEEYLSNICMKAWLPPDAWIDKNTKIYKFCGQIFAEIEPKGDIREKNLDGSNR